mmetsp:Transcript_13271/g.37256  ORF Transcript_13271/g.37256 Transcript_13271/m.37256 type:complete len:217 (+) Transcript_13271:1890-2540(+)
MNEGDRYVPSVLMYVMRPSPELLWSPSYSFWATIIVSTADMPNLEDASCCRVDVVRGLLGDFLDTLSFTRVRKISDSSTDRAAASASSSLLRENFPSFSPWALTRLAPSKVCLASGAAGSSTLRSHFTLQYSCGTNLAISSSLSQIILSAADCTLPALLLPGSFLHSTGLRLNPTRWSRARLALYASTSAVETSLLSDKDPRTACLVTSLKVMRSI